MTSTYEVVIYGPNLSDQDKGDIHVHLQGCQHPAPLLLQGKVTAPADAFTVDSKQEAVFAIYPPDHFEYDADQEWEDYAESMYWAPCVRFLPRTLRLDDEGIRDVVGDRTPGVIGQFSLPGGTSIHFKQAKGSGGAEFVLTVHKRGQPAERLVRGSRDTVLAALPAYVLIYTEDDR